MKLFACLFCLASIAGVQSSEFFDAYEQQYLATVEFIKETITEILSDDGTDFQPQVKELITLVESQLCPDEDAEDNAECDSGSNWLLGCKCTSEFAGLEGNCKNTPCKMIQHFKDNAPKAMSDFMAANSYEEMMTVVMNVVEEIWRILCECRGVVDAAISCARNYDGLVFILSSYDRTNFDEIVNHVEWETARGIVHGYLDAICGEENGEDCPAVLSNWQAGNGIFFDNTFNGVDTCISMIRAEKETKASVDAMVYEEGMDMESYIDGWVDAYMKMEEKLICDADCAGEMQELIYSSCCVKRAAERLSTETMKTKYVKFFKNIWRFIYPGEAPELKNAVNRFMEMYRPVSFCGAKTDVYRTMNKQCNAIKA
ncbi:uncharacterized protein LOC134817484 [Bolinopsis microptera]|uniref:uncharacterized protein LOC134817484 n=1 Tax=Bolinopsis microptera TaxID=2820187 RepID=UPI003079CD50